MLPITTHLQPQGCALESLTRLKSEILYVTWTSFLTSLCLSSSFVKNWNNNDTCIIAF